jgi:hypothetical protein
MHAPDRSPEWQSQQTDRCAILRVEIWVRDSDRLQAFRRFEVGA